MCPLEAGIKLNETFVEPKVFKCLLSIFFNEKFLFKSFFLIQGRPLLYAMFNETAVDMK